MRFPNMILSLLIAERARITRRNRRYQNERFKYQALKTVEWTTPQSGHFKRGQSRLTPSLPKIFFSKFHKICYWHVSSHIKMRFRIIFGVFKCLFYAYCGNVVLGGIPPTRRELLNSARVLNAFKLGFMHVCFVFLAF